LKKGYERATARDIAAAAGVSLAAIGYHFRSREALLTEALLVAIGEWDRDFRQTLEAGVPRAASPRKRFEAVWAQLIRTFETHRALWIANFELFFADGSPAGDPPVSFRTSFASPAQGWRRSS
jgi:AcrR family transcriptional regulator